MCGIAGLLRFDGIAPDPALLHRMTDAIAHRGPDGSGHWQEGPIALGHRRLAIIDLSVDANQPMWSSDGSLAIVFNGEIYNYRELALELAAAGLSCRTTSDTEVILNLYRLHGTDCLGKLRGMFAFALWDRSKQRLFLARDRVGIKPLYILRRDGVFAFASEIKAIAVTGLSRLRVDRDALAGFFRFLVVPQPASIFDDIRKLEPGRYLLVTPDGTVREETWWTPPLPIGVGADGDDAAQITALGDTLRESVRYHMVADVPVGAFLSGGLDSSAVVSLMRAEVPGKAIHAFSIGFPGQAKYDEEPYARQVADLKQIDFHAGAIDERFVDDLDAMAWHLDEPFAITSAWATYYLARQAARQMKVVLTGDGGDELFAGYTGHQNEAYTHGAGAAGPINAFYGVVAAGARAGVLRGAAASRLLTGLARRSGSEGLRYSEQVALNSLHAISLAISRDLFLPALATWRGNLMARYYDDAQSPDRLGRKLYAEYKTRLVDEMLMKVDRMTMAHSLEARVPLLDHLVVETAFRLPSHLKLGRNADGSVESKYALKKAMAAYLPDDIVYRRKQGFDIPVATWLQGPFLDAMGDRLLGGHLRQAGIVREEGVRALLAHAGNPGHNYYLMLMVLLALEAWTDAYSRRVGAVHWG
ncbi:MAG: asparagine synthase (glutamine-hydrolyzing) [Gammaproteobacteria bacterium]|nr:asparagine synthase (glutamine-hydrolyzing) [Gammaproteobacteria bacterium]